MNTADVAVVGGGIVGLAFAYAHARRGRKVVLFERTDFAVGASIRNFGLLWPVGQRAGAAHDRAMLSREIWLDMIERAPLWAAPAGSLHLAYAQDEMSVLEEYLHRLGSETVGRKLLNKEQTLARSHAVNPERLIGALWSPTEINIDPREAIHKIPLRLKESFGVQLAFGVNVREISLPKISTSAGEWMAKEAIVCSGADFQTLFPEAFVKSGLTLCKLQMMRTAPQPGLWQLGPSLCAGLTLAHYDSFKNCLSLESLRKRIERDFPFCVENGIHVLLSQTGLGELTIGDSHHYGTTLQPFDRIDIDEAILSYLKTFAMAPSFEIAERWNGTYPKRPGETEFLARPADGVLIATGLGGAGMTLSFGLAEEIVSGRSPGH